MQDAHSLGFGWDLIRTTIDKESDVRPPFRSMQYVYMRVMYVFYGKGVKSVESGAARRGIRAYSAASVL